MHNSQGEIRTPPLKQPQDVQHKQNFSPSPPTFPRSRIEIFPITVVLSLVLDSINYTDYTYPAYINKITAMVMNLPRNPGNKIPRHKSKHRRDHGRSLGQVKSWARASLCSRPQLQSSHQSNPLTNAIPPHPTIQTH